MTFIKIAIGLFGLGVVVFIHELGHFLAARFCKIGVEAFSIGWGPPLLKKKIKEVEYRIGMFPVGGYCKFKGASDHGVNEYKEAYDLYKEGKKPEDGSFLASTPKARMLTCFAGPFFNLIFAALLLTVLGSFGYDVSTLNSKIILASEITQGETYPADIAGLKTGDRIIAINDKIIEYSHEAQEIITLNPNKELTVWVERSGKILSFTVVPSLDTSTGAGRIGVYFWIDPVIDSVKEGSPAQLAGLDSGFVIVSANGKPINNTMDLVSVMGEEHNILTLEYARFLNSETKQVQFSNEEIENGLGISWQVINYRTPNLPLHKALVKGVKDTWKTLILSIKSLRLLFMGVDLTQAVSGPVRITYMMGDIAAQGMNSGFGVALRSFMEFIALISIALCIMNLLPLPIIDGGMIILFFVEMLRKKPTHPKTISVFQGIGMVIIFGLMFFALFGDILYFINR